MPVSPPSWLAVGMGTLAHFLVGGLWYSPLLFGKVWQKEVGLSDAELAKSAAKVFGLAVVLALIGTVNLGFFLGGKPDPTLALLAGAATGIGWGATSVAMTQVFERRSAKLIAIDAGYPALAYTLVGAVFAWLG